MNEWISVKDQLPLKQGVYEIRSDSQGQSRHAIWTGSEWKSVVMAKGSLVLHAVNYITHWKS